MSAPEAAELALPENPTKDRRCAMNPSLSHSVTGRRFQQNDKGVAVRFVGGTCGLLGHSCGHPEPPRRDADEPLEVLGDLALVREPARAATCSRVNPAPFAPRLSSGSCAKGKNACRSGRKPAQERATVQVRTNTPLARGTCQATNWLLIPIGLL